VWNYRKRMMTVNVFSDRSAVSFLHTTTTITSMAVGIFKAFQPSIEKNLLFLSPIPSSRPRTAGGLRVIAPAAAQEQEEQQP
jgi:hypothetical protein